MVRADPGRVLALTDQPKVSRFRLTQRWPVPAGPDGLQRRYWRWFCVLVALVMLVAVPVVVAAHHYQQGVEGQCAVRFEDDKPNLAGYHWSWWWLPGWVCEFDREGRRWERRLW
jgi:hypothetical protein